MQVIQNNPTGPTTVYNEQQSPGLADARAKYPLCIGAPCALDLLLKTSGESCFDLDARCDGWHTAADREAVYQCAYGPYDVPLFECNAYAPMFNFDARTGGEPYADPLTGARAGQAVALPVTADLMAQGVMPPDGARNCWPTGWGMMNPLGWVYQPVRCAIEWAFVPREAAVRVTMARLAGGWAGTPPALVTAAAENWTQDLPELGGCEGPSFTFAVSWPVEVSQVWRPLYACDGWGATLATLAKLITSLAIVIGGVRIITQYAGKSVGFTGLGGN